MLFLIVIVIASLLFVVHSAKNTEPNQKRLLYIYLVTWGVTLIMSSFGFFDMEVPGGYAYFLLILHLIAFTAGALMVSTTSLKKQALNDYKLANIENSIVRTLNSPIFKIIIVLMSIYVTYVFSKYWIKVLLYDNISDTRDLLVDIYGDFYYTFARPLLFLPTTIVCYVLFGYSLFKKRDWVCIVMGYYLVVNASLTGGRFGYVYIAMGVVFVELYIVKANLRKHWLKFAFAAAALYGAIVLITTFRSGSISMDKNNLEYGTELANEQIVTYVVGSQAAFDYAINNDYLTQVGGYGLGSFTFTPVVNLLDIFTTSFIGLKLNKHVLKYITYLEDTPIYLEGGKQQWNALYTSVITYYLDAGIIGVFLFPFILGMMSSFLIRKMLKSGSVLIFALCGYFFICMVKSILKMEILFGYDSLAIAAMFIIGSFKMKKHGIKQLRQES